MLRTADVWKGIVTLLVMPLLPDGLRKRWSWPSILPDAPAQWFTCLLHIFLAALLWALAFVAYQTAFGEAAAEAMWKTAEKDGDLNMFAGWAGIVGFFAFPFTLKGFLAWSYLLDGVVRFVVLSMHGEYSGSVFVAAPYWTYLGLRAVKHRLHMDATYGRASLPDRLHEEGRCMVIRCARPHPEWHERLTFRYRDALYRLEWEGDVVDGDRRCFTYRFGPWPEAELIRRIVILEGEEAKDPSRSG